MAYLGSLIFLFALWGAWLLYRHRLERARWFLRTAPWVVILPFLVNTCGWMLTENGRQPWIVQGLMLTKNGVSSSVSATDLWISLVVFYLIYVVLGVSAAWLMIRYGRRSIGDDPLAKITDDGTGGSNSGTGTGSTTDAELDSSREDEDDLALVY